MGSDPIPPPVTLIDVSADPADGVVLSACKVADDRRSVILRLFNPLDRETRVSVKLPPTATGVYTTDLAEHRGSAFVLENDEATVTLWPHQIQTIELALRGPDA